MARKLDIRKRDFRRHVSNMAAKANKRIERLEKNNLQSSPAYQKWIEDGGERFSIKGKSYNEVQSELAKISRFVDSKTSTIRGLNNTLKEMASATGIKYDNLADLRSKADQFFELASKTEQYLRSVEDIASAIGYQKIWEAINQYVKDANIDLTDANLDIDQMSAIVGGLLADVDSGNVTGEEPDFWIRLK